MLAFDWEGLARTAILDMLDEHYAVTAREIEARAANDPWPSVAQRIDPDILTTARRDLTRSRTLNTETATTRGLGEPIRTWSRADRRGIATRSAKAAARKRLLTARHHSWSQATPRYPKGLIGRAGEEAVENLLRDDENYSHITRDADSVLGHEIDGGSLDFTAYLTTSLANRPVVYTTLIEVKNQRQWFYAHNRDLHRFLYKAAAAQVASPNEAILPVFVSSRRHNSTWMLGRLLGFYAVRYEAQFVLPTSDISLDHFNDVVHGLGYTDLILDNRPNNKVRRALTESLRKNAPAVADRWRAVAPHIVDLH